MNIVAKIEQDAFALKNKTIEIKRFLIIFLVGFIVLCYGNLV